MTRSQRVLLVGASEQENLALRYLAAAAEQAGHTVELCGFEGPDDGPAVLGAVERLKPDLIGLSIAFQRGIGDYAGLARAVR